MSHTLAPLLEVLGQPDNPAFAQALAQVAAFVPQGLTAAEVTALLATLDQTITALMAEQDAAAVALTRLRNQRSAASAYQGKP